MFVPIGGVVAIVALLLLAALVAVLWFRVRAQRREIANLRELVRTTAQIEEILARAEGEPADPQHRRRRFRIIPGGLAGVALGAAWAVRQVRDHPLASTAAAAGATAAAGLVAVPLLLGPGPQPDREAMPDPRPPAAAPAAPGFAPTPDQEPLAGRPPPPRQNPAPGDPPAAELAAPVPSPTLGVELDAALPSGTGDDGGLPVLDSDTPEVPDLQVDTDDPPALPLPDLPAPPLPELPVEVPPLPIPSPAPNDEADEGELLCVEAQTLGLELAACLP